MARKINSLEELVIMMGEAVHLAPMEVKKGVTKAALKVQADAKTKFGHYQPEVGPFNAWAVLAEDTIKRKAKAGGGEDPLIGHYVGKRNAKWPTTLRESIDIEVRGLVGYVGTNNPLGPYHEFGTSRIPPRPYLRPALYENESFIRKCFSDAIATAFSKSIK